MRYLKFFLSLGVLTTFFIACEKDISNLNAEERKALSYKVFKEGEHLPQGSPKSMTRLERAIAIDPTNCDALRELSVAHLKRGMPLDWYPQFEKAALCDPKIWVPWRGYLYLQFYRDYDKALADFNASDTLTPNFTDAPQGQSVDYWRGIAYLGRKDYEYSILFFDTYIEKETLESGEDWVELTAFLYRGIAHFENGNYEEALRDFDKQLNYARGFSADAKYFKAQVFMIQNRCKEAKELVTSGIEDYNYGYYNQHPYTEALRQLYLQDFEVLMTELTNKCPNQPS